MRTAAAVCLLSLLSSAAWASFYDGRHLRQIAEARNRVLAGQGQGEDVQEALTFNAYVLGVFDALEGVKQICPKRGVRVEQVMDAVSNHVRRLPAARLNQPADAIIGEAMKSAFPCMPVLFPPP